MSFTTFSVGRDTQLVVLGPSGRVDLEHVVAFESRQLTPVSMRVSFDWMALSWSSTSGSQRDGKEGSFEL